MSCELSGWRSVEEDDEPGSMASMNAELELGRGLAAAVIYPAGIGLRARETDDDEVDETVGNVPKSFLVSDIFANNAVGDPEPEGGPKAEIVDEFEMEGAINLGRFIKLVSLAFPR